MSWGHGLSGRPRLAPGNPQESSSIRNEIVLSVGQALDKLKPGSPPAAAFKKLLIKKCPWSQYLEVGIGPDAELFTKGQPMSAVDYGEDVDMPRQHSTVPTPVQPSCMLPIIKW
jgi:fumarylacetoacetate (FAA) hydrolase family protein